MSYSGKNEEREVFQYLEELGKDIRPTYTGNKLCGERLKRSILNARILIREVGVELEKVRGLRERSKIKLGTLKEREEQNAVANAAAVASDKEREEKKKREKEEEKKATTPSA